MSALDLLSRLRRLRVRLWAEDGDLRMRARRGVLTPEVRLEIAREKAELLALLEGARAPGVQGGPSREIAEDPRGPRLLSAGQERLWRLHSKAPGSAAHNLPLAFDIAGQLDVPAFERALGRLVDRHDNLRAVISLEESRPTVRLTDRGGFRLPLTDLAALGCDRRRIEEELEKAIRDEAGTPFNLQVGPLFRVRLWRLAAEEHAFSVVMHHLVSDGLSFDILIEELREAYAAEIEGRSPRLAPLQATYRDFVAWEREQASSTAWRPALAYWAARLSPEVRPPRLLTATGRGRGDDRGHRLSGHAGRDLCKRLEGVGTASNTTPFMTLLAAYLVALRGLTAQDDLVVCTPVAGREKPEFARVIGYFNNLLPLRVDVGGDLRFLDLLSGVREAVLGAHRHRAMPFHEIAALPAVRRTPLTRVMFGFQDDPSRALELVGVRVRPRPVDNASADFDLGLAVEGANDGLTATLTFREGAIAPSDAQRVLDDFLAVLEEVVANPEAPVNELVPVAELPAAVESASQTALSDEASPTWVEDAAAARRVGPARDPLELQLALIWRRVLGVDVGPSDDFFELGGHSLLAVHLLEAMESELGLALPLATFFETSTIEDLARTIRDGGWEAPAAPLVTMQAEGDGLPVFVLHSFEGHVFFYNDLARALAPDHPVYGIQAIGLDGREHPLETVELMAAHYERLIRSVQPDGPVVLVAMCFGFTVGLELAQRLFAAGEEVELILLDGGFPQMASPPSDPPSPSHTFGWMRRRVLGLRERARRAVRYASATPYARRELRLRRAAIAAWHRYDPQPYGGIVTLIRCEDTAADPDRDWHLEALERLAGDRGRIVHVPGHHFSMLRAPNVEAVAGRIRQALAQRTVGAG